VICLDDDMVVVMVMMMMMVVVVMVWGLSDLQFCSRFNHSCCLLS
jgi:hypothetical protein